MRHIHFTFTIFLVSFLAAVTASAQEFDPVLAQKSADYEAFLREWHSTGLGGVSDVVFTDANRTELLQTWGSGDSEDWTGFYLATQSMRYIITGEAQARDEVRRIAGYLHIVKDITGDPGYIARYVAPDQPPWNVETLNNANKYPGEGAYAGDFWLGEQVRDKYITWFWSLTWAYDALTGPEDEDMRQTIRDDFREVVDTLDGNNWTIVDPWGHIYSAAQILADLRLAIVLQAAHVLDDPVYWDMLDQIYEANKNLLWVSSFSFFNKYFDYFAFINNHPSTQAIFRLWPDRPRLEHMFRIWNFNVRQWSKDTHNAFFDAVYYEGCRRLGSCDPDELTALTADIRHGLEVMNDAPNWQRAVTCRDDLPLDPFSVWAHQVLTDNPWLGQLTGLDIQVQTSVAHEVDDRCWVSTLWESSPYHLACTEEDNPAHTTHGQDYLIAYWLSVYYGILPGGGPYGDDDLPAADDDTVDDASDDTVDDDAADDAVDDDSRDDDTFTPSSGGDDDSGKGCGC